MKNHRLARFIRRGGIIAYPTESCFGLGCDPKNKQAINKIIKLKKRSRIKNFILIGSSIKQFDNFISPLNDATQKKLFSKWPGPHTWLINVNNRCPNWLKSNSKIALRIPSFSKCQDLARSIDMAITSTSLNLSGKIPLKNYRDVCRFLPNQVKLIGGRIGKNKKPSVIQDFKTNNIIRS
jgi:L-threonylcarbamoyladenylate synthase